MVGLNRGSVRVGCLTHYSVGCLTHYKNSVCADDTRQVSSVKIRLSRQLIFSIELTNYVDFKIFPNDMSSA